MTARQAPRFRDLVDVEKLRSIMASFYRLTEIGSSIVDLDGNILVGDYATGWKRICMEFHRKHPETLARCVESDTILCNRLLRGEKYVRYSCLNGMVDSAVPITIDGDHVANLLSGQYFVAPPDESSFREQARRYGFDEAAYLEALGEVAVLPPERVKEGARFLTDLAEMIGRMALSSRDVVDANERLESRVRERTQELVRTNERLEAEIAERRRAELALRESEAQLKEAALYARSLIEAALDPLVTISPEGKITDVNEATVKVTGVPRAELVGTDFSGYFTDPAKAKEGYRRVFAQGSVTDYPLTIRRRDGGLTDVLYHASLYRDAQGRVLGVFAAARDVTERKRAEEALAEERQRFNDVFETLPSYIILLTPDYRVSYANRVFRERFGEAGGRRCYEYLFGRSEPCENCETFTVMRTGAPHHWEWLGPDGRTYDIHDFPFTERDGSRCILENGTDVTERKRAEEEVRRALREKETLLREIHHRVKNNLQVVSSLLDLQSQKIGDAGLREMFQESQQRVRSIALVHEKMYQTRSLSAIDFREYLAVIVGELSTFYNTVARKIATAVDVEPLDLSLDLAIPCALVVNELLTNAYKHAFAGRERGTVRIGFHASGGSCALSIVDDGIGLAQGLDWRRTPTLGFQLVTVLAKQLKGAVEVASGDGVAVTITFPHAVAGDGAGSGAHAATRP